MPDTKVTLGLLAEINILNYPIDVLLIGSGGADNYLLSGDFKFKEEIDIGKAVQNLANQFSVISNSYDSSQISILDELKLRIKKLQLKHTNKITSFIFNTEWTIESGKNLSIDVEVRTGTDTNNQKSFEVGLFLNFSNTHRFDLNLKKQGESIFFVAQYKNEGELIKLKDLIDAVSSSLGKNIPESFEFKINQIFFAYEKQKDISSSTTKFLFGLDLGMNLDFANLPLLGEYIPTNKKFSVENLRLIYASEKFDLNQSLSSEQQADFVNFFGDSKQIDRGICLGTSLYYMGDEENLSFPIAIPDKNSNSNSSPTKQLKPEPKKTEQKKETSFSLVGNTLWLNLNKNWKFFELKRIGAQYQDGDLFVLLDASVSVASLKITCDGLGVGSSLKEFDPKFKIPAIAIEYKGSAPLEIGGAFYWQELTKQEQKEFKFKLAGLVLVKTEAFAITAIGAYAQFLNGDSSFLVYGVLDKTIGGPPFFLVTGLALGFGYNRTVKTPSLDEVKNFPLVKIALSEKGTGDLVSTLRDLDTCLSPKRDEMFLAVGIKFTSFKIINSFVLLIAKFGQTFELDFLGFSTLIMPPAELGSSIEPISKIEIAIVGTFKPAEGILKVDGKILEGSYLFSPEAKISGGFAFYAWFKGDYEGDFVLTVGGYHPQFNIPAHYPKVDRLQFDWPNVKGSDLSIKGSAYFALTSSAIMAGGRFEAIWNSGSLKAYFIYEIDFILAWKPFFYDAKIAVKIGVSYTFSKLGIRKTFEVDISANLHIWGPEFSGRAKIDLRIIEFELIFGAGSSSEPPALTWKEFQQSFLPTDDQICSISVTSGLIKQIGTGESVIWVINPKDFALTTNTVIPIREVSQSLDYSKEPNKQPNKQFGIASMKVKSDEFKTSTHEIKITRGESNVDNEFNYEPIYKNVPLALWGESNKPNLNAKSLIESVLSGVVIKPKIPTIVGVTNEINCKNLAYETTLVKEAYYWDKFATFTEITNTETSIKESIQKNNRRSQILEALGFEREEIDNIDLDDFTDEEKLQQSFVTFPSLQANVCV